MSHDTAPEGRTTMWFILIILAGLLLRLIGLDRPLATDEICSWAFARRMPFMAMWNVD